MKSILARDVKIHHSSSIPKCITDCDTGSSACHGPPADGGGGVPSGGRGVGGEEARNGDGLENCSRH